MKMSKATAKKKNNVVKLRSPEKEAEGLDQVGRYSLAGLTALGRTADRLEGVRKDTEKKGKLAFKDAVARCRSGRDFAEVIAGSVSHAAEAERLGEVLAGLRMAELECLGAVDRASSTQGDMFDVGAGDQIPGLGWASPPTQQAIYTCLLGMEERGEGLNPFMADLFMVLGGAGLEVLDLGIPAAEAVETDQGTEAELDDEGNDIDVGF
jgi:hypothetical protein